MDTLAILQGFLLGASLIIAIGPQNAFVISQGLKRQHVFLCALICSLIDALLIAVGVMGLGAIFSSHPLLIEAARWFGAIFLTVYGLLSFKSACSPSVLKQGALSQPTADIKKIIAVLLSLSFLNPHVYLDTVILIGSIAAQHPGNSRIFFGAGAALASFIWFFGIAYGAKLLTPLFKKAIAWRILDIIIGCIMWVIAFELLFYR